MKDYRQPRRRRTDPLMARLALLGLRVVGRWAA